jgi:hypothetical protein
MTSNNELTSESSMPIPKLSPALKRRLEQEVDQKIESQAQQYRSAVLKQFCEVGKLQEHWLTTLRTRLNIKDVPFQQLEQEAWEIFQQRSEEYRRAVSNQLRAYGVLSESLLEGLQEDKLELNSQIAEKLASQEKEKFEQDLQDYRNHLAQSLIEYGSANSSLLTQLKEQYQFGDAVLRRVEAEEKQKNEDRKFQYRDQFASALRREHHQVPFSDETAQHLEKLADALNLSGQARRLIESEYLQSCKRYRENLKLLIRDYDLSEEKTPRWNQNHQSELEHLKQMLTLKEQDVESIQDEIYQQYQVALREYADSYEQALERGQKDARQGILFQDRDRQILDEIKQDYQLSEAVLQKIEDRLRRRHGVPPLKQSWHNQPITVSLPKVTIPLPKAKQFVTSQNVVITLTTLGMIGAIAIIANFVIKSPDELKPTITSTEDILFTVFSGVVEAETEASKALQESQTIAHGGTVNSYIEALVLLRDIPLTVSAYPKAQELRDIWSSRLLEAAKEQPNNPTAQSLLDTISSLLAIPFQSQHFEEAQSLLNDIFDELTKKYQSGDVKQDQLIQAIDKISGLTNTKLSLFSSLQFGLLYSNNTQAQMSTGGILSELRMSVSRNRFLYQLSTWNQELERNQITIDDTKKLLDEQDSTIDEIWNTLEKITLDGKKIVRRDSCSPISPVTENSSYWKDNIQPILDRICSTPVTYSPYPRDPAPGPSQGPSQLPGSSQGPSPKEEPVPSVEPSPSPSEPSPISDSEVIATPSPVPSPPSYNDNER